MDLEKELQVILDKINNAHEEDDAEEIINVLKDIPETIWKN